MKWNLSPLPLSHDIETKKVLKKAAMAHRALAELKSLSSTIPNEAMLLNTLTMQEAKDSSEVESIITTQDELFKAELQSDFKISIATKEVQNYSRALRTGFQEVRTTKILTFNNILQIQEELEQNDAGIRKQVGTSLRNDKTGEIIYTPPQDPQTITNLLSNLVQFINDDSISDLDPLVKMAIIHHQFESIHPFYDGNGRTGRIINILYLVRNDLLKLPILYLSRYVVNNKSQYYNLLQEVRDTGEWENWIIFMLDGIAKISNETVELIQGIKTLVQEFKVKIRKELPKIYSQDLLNSLFKHPYTKTEFIMKDLQVERRTATKYLDLITGIGLLRKEKHGRTNYYLNEALIHHLSNPKR